MPSCSIFFTELQAHCVGQETMIASTRKRKAESDGEQEIKKARPDDIHFDIEAELPIDLKLQRHSNSSTKYRRKQFWYFLLALLMDSRCAEVIAWTGKGREFIILDPTALMAAWSHHQDKQISWPNVQRNFRCLCERRVLMAVATRARRYAFLTEPSAHIDGLSREGLSDFIANNKWPGKDIGVYYGKGAFRPSVSDRSPYIPADPSTAFVVERNPVPQSTAAQLSFSIASILNL